MKTIRKVITTKIRVRVEYDDEPGGERFAMARMRQLLRESGGCCGGPPWYSIKILGPERKVKR